MNYLVGGIIFSLAIYGTNTQSVKDLITNKEQITTGIANEVERLYRFRCNTQSDCNKSCSDSACAIDFTNQPTCSKVFGGYESFCGVGNQGQFLNYNVSTLTFSPGLSSKDPIVRESVCAFRKLNDVFVSNKANFNHSTWQYFGDANGVFRYYPGYARGFLNGLCRPFEHRIRPWYIAAATGPKDVVIIIDRSGSMLQNVSSTQSRLDVVKTAVYSLLDTFSFTDFVSVVSFSTNSTIAGGNQTLLRADVTNIKYLKDEVNKIVAGGETNFELGLQTAFDLLSRSSNQSTSDNFQSSGCQKVILFLTDGDRTVGVEPIAFTETQQKILENVRNCNGGGSSCHSSLFTFSIGTNITSVGNAELKNLACANKGVWTKINQGEDPFISMSSYFKFLALGNKNNDVIWTTPYQDDFGLGLVSTAAQAVYDDQSPFPEILIGVAASDILVSDLSKSSDYNVVFNELINQSNHCRNLTTSSCQLQLLRSSISNFSVCTTGPDSTDVNICSNTDNVVLRACSNEFPLSAVCTDTNRTVDLKSRTCCNVSSTTTVSSDHQSTASTVSIVGAVVGGAVAITLVALAVWYFFLRKKSEKVNSGPPSTYTPVNVDDATTISK
ncbi:hypothetical protein HK096_011013 [Nowakowskiella sp. JEL0078]|nr:hypothetical protein HK096_011013 [Nowakowskiella sp. JEL0078]